jgi:hypothetical protein
LDNYFRKLKNSSFFVRLDVERTHINQKIEFLENPTSACQTTVASPLIDPMHMYAVCYCYQVAISYL